MFHKVIFNPQTRLFKVVSLFLVFIILGEIIFPATMLAITTNGASQPEVYAYQPVDATDNVSLTTGAFNYTIPITSIPEYPMAISYRSGVQPGQEAGVFGLGFHGFSGAIGRNMVGLPDDIAGATRNYDYTNQKKWSATAGATIGISILKFGNLGGISPSITLMGGYDNYLGAFGSIGFGISASVGTSVGSSNLSVGAGCGLSIVSDSRSSSATMGGGVGLSVGYNLTKATDTRRACTVGDSFASAGFSQKVGDKSSRVTAASTVMSVGITNFSSSSSSSVQSLAPLSNVLPVNRGWGIFISVPLPIGGPVSVSINAGYNQSELVRNHITKRVFGFQHLDKVNRRDDSHLADFTIEGEIPFPSDAVIASTGHDPRVNPNYLQRDYFVANAMGFAGAMQLNQEEYGVVSRGTSRNQYRDIGILSVKTSREESFPWTTMDDASFNNAVDILKLLKGGSTADSDFDAVMFKQNEKSSLTRDEHLFGRSQFKMRGELSGEFNQASENFKDHEPNEFELQKVEGTGGSVSGFMRVGREMVLYEPKAKAKTSKLFNGAGSIKKSTKITHRTIEEIVKSYDRWREHSPELFTDNNFKLNQTFYSHYSYLRSGEKFDNKSLNENVTSFNILQHLKDLNTQNPAESSIIGAIEVQNVSGLKYIFNLPAFAKQTETMILSGKGKYAPKMKGDDYKSFSNIERNKVRITDNYQYPYAWMLTAIVGEDYIDFDGIPGPSDGDIGYWVKFKYTKTSDDYRWRYPFTGLAYMPNSPSTYGDDAYNLTTGLKEIYVLSEIESSSYVCKYEYQKRFDGLDAKGRINGEPRNPLVDGDEIIDQDMTGSNYQFVVSSIDLYKKHPEGENSKVIYSADKNKVNTEPYIVSKYGRKVKSTRFKYDYSLSSDVPNNLANYYNISQESLDYYYNPKSGEKIGTGRLTLRSVQHIAYDVNGMEEPLPAYNFKFWSDVDNLSGEHLKYNPSFNEQQKDAWGNFNYNASTPNLATGFGGVAKLYHPYCEYDTTYANYNAKVWHLKEISLPSGGKLDVKYEAQSYSYVENKPVYNMRRINKTAGVSRQSTYTLVSVDVTDICLDEKAEAIANGESLSLKGLKKILKVGDKLYGQITFYQTNEKQLGRQYVAEADIQIEEFIPQIEEESVDGLTRYYQTIKVSSANPSTKYVSPFYREVENFMFIESEQTTAIRQSLPMSCHNVEGNLRAMENLEKADPMDAVEKAIANFRNIFTGDSKAEQVLSECFGRPGSNYIPEMSFIRTPVYKAQYTGSRVASLFYDDQFNYSTAINGGLDNHSNIYGTSYFYDENSNGKGISAGVATIEPFGGKAAAIDVNSLVGMGYLPSPAIISSKTTMAGYYKDTDTSEDGIQSREKGKTVYEFYTPKDDGLGYRPTEAIKTKDCIGGPINPSGYFNQFGMIVYFLIKFKVFGKRVTIKIPFPLPITILWTRRHNYHLQSYSYLDYTDIYGRPKSVAQLNSGSVEEGKQEFKYFGVDEPVPVYKEGFAASDLNLMKPGKVDQAWSEAWYSKKTDLSLIPWILFFSANTKSHYSYVNMKYSYLPPVMKEVITTVDGQKTVTQNTGFDYYTGTPIEVRSSDSYGNVKIKQTLPAYWKYPEMGSADLKESNTNNLTAKAASYLYLNDTKSGNVLGASVTRWDKSSWDIVDYLQPSRVATEGNSYRYVYNKIVGEDIKKAYSITGRSNDQYVKRNTVLYKPVETYTYEVGLNPNGTFTSFVDFNFKGSNGTEWKMVSKSELFDANGVLVQASDILNKRVSQHMGYNFSKAISLVANGTYGETFYDGAENSYEVDGQTVLENNKVKLNDATVFKGNCKPIYEDKLLDGANYLQGVRAANLDLIQIKKPSVIVPGQVFGRIELAFTNGLKRTLFISQDEQKRYRLNSSLGEDFNGFLVLPSTSTQEDFLLFDLDQLSSLTIGSVADSHGFNMTKISRSMSQSYVGCTDFPLKNYQMPKTDCVGDVHTGNYAFSLKGQGSGTYVELNKSELGDIEYARKFKAMVWVLNSSPKETELVVRRTDIDGNKSEEAVGLDQPYAQSGNWLLLRSNFDLKGTIAKEVIKVEVFVRNNSSEGVALYDDLRVLPYNAEMSNYVYDNTFDRVTSTIDADNFATFNEYDNRGRVIRSSVEIDGLGKTTIKQMMYNDQKKSND